MIDLVYGYRGVFGLLVLAADLYAIISVINGSSSTGKKVLWILLILFLPLLGWILWFLFGPRSEK